MDTNDFWISPFPFFSLFRLLASVVPLTVCPGTLFHIFITGLDVTPIPLLVPSLFSLTLLSPSVFHLMLRALVYLTLLVLQIS